MRLTLRRSCNACAKAKHSCDLRTPQCSRCAKRKSQCVYANRPLNPPTRDQELMKAPQPASTAFDPFDSYPPTRLPRAHVQRLIHHFLAHISFQYYPLDLEMDSNPFVISWWPQALADGALFHVSLQTASLDVELRAGQGFPISELLMADSVALVRRKVESSVLAFQNETLNSVVTLAAIEYGKGNTEASKMHIDGVKRMVSARGGISEVKRASPLTARMISWVSLIVTGAPQFLTQDDESGGAEGIGSIPQWRLASAFSDLPNRFLDNEDLDPTLRSIMRRLHTIFHQPRQMCPLTNLELHDLTCFVIHRLLLLPDFIGQDSKQSVTSECLRYALVLYLLIIHGTTYYSHHDLSNNLLLRLKGHLEALGKMEDTHGPLGLWIISVGMIASTNTAYRQWFTAQACIYAEALNLQTWADVLLRLDQILWIQSPQESLFRQKWQEIMKVMAG
ncbi:hypothetical protein PFICI_13035 [Pestalotiopsis fici W106-1]|uniref:Zn(2)-C6 fungal-type domain-containing protein n=1 Tax=Pestalotiopsis fici (strain W106-1 / CGMCC3.15140) TaxID=1229662 RepID=W3WP06_PESFW|nr:uncharacterized protein PFICI_13035 [Pestalotiopsis fici W106-1]ETS74551.1 hypothetical protein PFICI_13035 [Pestalotiopsis fici W106-1]